MKIKNVLKFLSYLLLFAVWVVMLAFTSGRQNETACRDIKVQIDHHTGLFFLDEEEIIQIMHTASGTEMIKGTLARNLPLSKIEHRLMMNPFIESAKVFMTPKGVLHAKIEQRNPLLRVINKHNVSYYLDVKGETMPVSANFTARVPVVNGYITGKNLVHQRDSVLQGELFELGEFISTSPFWNAFVQQIYVNEQREFEIVPRIGHQVIYIGEADDLEEKFRKLYIFYKEGLRTGSWEKYKTINVKYKDQIVCSKI